MPGKKLLVLIEDDDAVNDALTMLLTLWGFEVRAHLNSSSLKPSIDYLADMFLIDRQLSTEDGLDICKKIKANSATSGIPVIVMSAGSDIGALASAAGADSFLRKPFTKTEFQNSIKGLWRDQDQ